MPVPEQQKKVIQVIESKNPHSKNLGSGTGAPARQRGKKAFAAAALGTAVLLPAVAFMHRSKAARTPRTVVMSTASNGRAAPKDAPALAERVCSALHRIPAE